MARLATPLALVDRARPTHAACLQPAAVPAWALASLSLASLLASASPGAHAQAMTPLGVQGGLVVPTARTLPEGTIAVSLSNLPEPGLLYSTRSRSKVLGFGLLEGLEISGRFGEYSTREPSGYLAGGISDLAFNAKVGWSLGDSPSSLRLAAGLMDYGGAATKFRANYLVATQALGPVEWTLGAGRSQALIFSAQGHRRALDGAFGSVSMELLPATSRWGQLQALVEHDNRQPLVGGRWASSPVPWLADARVSAAWHRAWANGPAHPVANVWAVGMSWNLAERERRAATAVGPQAVVPPPEAQAPRVRVPEAAAASPTARLGRLQAVLQAQGLERVRVGRLADGSWVVAYQNRRFGQNEVDALGLVTGLAAEAAPEELTGLVVVALKQGQPALTLRTDPTAWRGFLRTGLPGLARGQAVVTRGRAIQDREVDWLSDHEGPATRVQLQLSPEIAYTFGTELGATDHSLAVRATVAVPLWRGGQLVAAAQQIVSHSARAEPWGPFAALRQSEGLHTLALQHTQWWGTNVVASAALGRFEYGALGAEGMALVFLPWREDVLRLRGRAVNRTAQLPPGADLAGAVSYRWVPSSSFWAEVGTQRYTSGSWGPTAVVGRWWGDVGVNLYFRKGGWRQYAGIEFSVPLTPRSASSRGPVHVQGSPRYVNGARSLVGNESNYVEPRNVRDLRLTWDLELQELNGGRLGPEYVLAHLPRMREAYLQFGKP